MKKTVIIIGFLSGIAAVILAVTKFYTLAITPIVMAFVSGLLLLYLSKNEPKKINPIQYIFLFVIISLGLTIYKGVSSSLIPETNEQILPKNKGDIKCSNTLKDTIKTKKGL